MNEGQRAGDRHEGGEAERRRRPLERAEREPAGAARPLDPLFRRRDPRVDADLRRIRLSVMGGIVGHSDLLDRARAEQARRAARA